MINCPYCGKLTDPQLDSCVHCGGMLKKQSGPRAARRGQTSQTCPSCGALVREGDIICLACGTNLLTGQKVAEEQRKAAAAKAVESRNWLPYVVGGALSLIVVIVAAALIMYLTQDPIAKANRLAKNGRMSEAVGVLESHVSTKTDDAEAYFALGKMYWLSGEMLQSAQNFEKAARLDQNNEEAARLAVLGYGQVQTPSSRDSQLALLERVTEADPNDAEMLYLLGLARGLKQDFPGQVEALERAQAADSANQDIARAGAVGRALQNDVDGAEIQLERADTSEADTVAVRGLLNAIKGDREKAIADLKSAVDGNTSIRDEAQTRLGLLLIEEGVFAEAMSHLEDAVRSDPTNATAKYFLAVCKERQRLTAQALSEFETIAETSGPYQSRAAVQAARLHLAQANPDRALQVLNRAPAPATPTDVAELETVRGRAHMALGDLDSARDAFRKALQADANYAPAHLENGLLLVQRQDLSEGIRELERYLKLVDPEQPDAGVSEVRALVSQLQRSVESGGGAGATETQAAADNATERNVS